MLIKDEIDYCSIKVDEIFKRYIDDGNFPSNTIKNAINYVLFHNGKKFRPFILYYIGKQLNINENILFHLGASIEMLHTYTLIHDDLPSLDNDKIRRGKNALHIEFSEAVAILVGDSLQADSYNLLTKITQYTGLQIEDSVILKIISVISSYSGSRNLISGQMLDLDFIMQNNFNNTNELQKNDVLLIYKLKTAKMIMLPCVIAGILANLSPSNIQKLNNWGECCGFIFQIVDDIEDAKVDTINNNTNLVNIIGLKESIKLLSYYNNKAMEITKDLESTLKHSFSINNINKYLIKDYVI